MRLLTVLVLLAAACGGEKKKNDEPTAAPAASDDAAAPPTRVAPDQPEPAKPPPPPTAEQRATYKKHLSKGRALEKEKEWKKAAAEFEAALAAIPNDGRALSELGWVAFQAGDYERAATANAESVKYSGDKKVKAASLYNLGRVAEVQGKPKEAAAHYQESLRLRPGNKIVTRALAKVGARPPKVGAFEGEKIAFCGQAMTEDDLCACHEKQYNEDTNDGGDISCSIESSPVAGIGHLDVEYNAGYDRFVEVQLVRKQADGTWLPVTSLGSGYGGRGHTEDWSVGKIEKRKVSGKEILWLEVTESTTDAWWDSDIEWERSSTEVVLCTLPDLSCDYAFPIAGSHDQTPVDENRDPTGEGESSDFHAELSLSDDGKATLKLVSGDREMVSGFLGTHQLW